MPAYCRSRCLEAKVNVGEYVFGGGAITNSCWVIKRVGVDTYMCAVEVCVYSALYFGCVRICMGTDWQLFVKLLLLYSFLIFSNILDPAVSDPTSLGCCAVMTSMIHWP